MGTDRHDILFPMQRPFSHSLPEERPLVKPRGGHGNERTKCPSLVTKLESLWFVEERVNLAGQKYKFIAQKPILEYKVRILKKDLLFLEIPSTGA